MVPDHRSEYRFGLVLVTLSAIVWSTAGLFTRMITVDSPTMLFWRGVFGALGILAFIFWCDGRSGIGRLSGSAWLYAVVSAAGMLCFITALRHTSVAHVATIYAAVPLIAGAAAWVVIGETMTRRAIAASIAALAGVVVMVGLGADGTLFGDALALLMTLAMAVMMIISRQARDIPMLPAAALSSLLSAVAVLPLANITDVPANEWLLLVSFGLVNSALGLALFTLGAQRLPPAETGLIGALDAPLAPVWVWLFFSQTPSTATLFGGIIVFSAVLYYMAANFRTSVSPV
jgi:drug/metabolite transporter (DMT)-like permease